MIKKGSVCGQSLFFVKIKFDNMNFLCYNKKKKIKSGEKVMKKKIITSVLVIINLLLSFACWYVLVIYSDINFYDSEIDGLQNIIYKFMFPSLIAFKIIFFVFSYIKLNKMYKNKVLRIILILAVTQGIIYGFNFIEITVR